MPSCHVVKIALAFGHAFAWEVVCTFFLTKMDHAIVVVAAGEVKRGVRGGGNKERF